MDGPAKNLLHDPAVRAVVINIRDVTEQKAAEQALQQSEERFALAVQATDDGIWDRNLVTKELYLSSRWKAILGYEVRSYPIVWMSLNSVCTPDDRARVLARFQECMKSRLASYNQEFRLRHKDGSYRWIVTRALVSRDANGLPLRVTGSITDVTEANRPRNR